jgi:hypothetical protein
MAINGMTPCGYLEVRGRPTEHSTLWGIEGYEDGLGYLSRTPFCTDSLSSLIFVLTTAVPSNSLSVWSTIY